MYGLNYGYRTSLSPLMIEHMKNKFLENKNELIKKKLIFLILVVMMGLF